MGVFLHCYRHEFHSYLSVPSFHQLAICDRWILSLGGAIDCQPLERPGHGVLFPGRKVGLSLCIVQEEDLSKSVGGSGYLLASISPIRMSLNSHIFPSSSDNSSPLSVREYSTFGGISSKSILLIRPYLSSSFRRSERIVSLIYLRSSLISLNRL